MMPGVEFEEIWKALREGYEKNSLKQMLRLRLNMRLDDIVNTEAPMRDLVFDLITKSEMTGFTGDLIREGYLFNSKVPDLLKVYEKYGFAPSISAQKAGGPIKEVRSVSDGLEKTIKQRLPAFDFGIFRERMSAVEERVCRIDLNGNAAGTGFLVGPDAVLTNFHVLEDVINNRSSPSKVTCKFGYEVNADKSRSQSITVGLHPDDWKLDFSPSSPAEKTKTPDVPPPSADELDYVLVRLARPVGKEPSTTMGNPDAPKRGWLSLPAVPAAFVPNMPLMIAQHPDGGPLKLALDTDAVLGVNLAENRVRYTVNTQPGSSGSPVFDFDWNLVALHHLGDPAYDTPPAYNQGIPIAAILARLQRPGNEAALAAVGDNQN